MRSLSVWDGDGDIYLGIEGEDGDIVGDREWGRGYD